MIPSDYRTPPKSKGNMARKRDPLKGNEGELRVYTGHREPCYVLVVLQQKSNHSGRSSPSLAEGAKARERGRRLVGTSNVHTPQSLLAQQTGQKSREDLPITHFHSGPQITNYGHQKPMARVRRKGGSSGRSRQFTTAKSRSTTIVYTR